ncbi:MAG TPA: metallophosphoesterase [Paracoccaceae bacterium]|nr:metallophosphoesterase [Paracoccaceae bacterium]
MKILAFSDLHLDERSAELICADAETADLVIGAGDFAVQRDGLENAMEMLRPLLPKAVLVPGNAESADELRAAAGPAVVLHGEGLERDGVNLFGLGYAVPETPFGSWSCDLTEAAAEELLFRMERADILIVHSPPKGVADRNKAGASIGSTSIRAAIERVQPRFALCGHIHDSWGISGMIGRTEVHNLGPQPNWFEV